MRVQWRRRCWFCLPPSYACFSRWRSSRQDWSKRSDIGLRSCQSRLRSACSSRDFSRHRVISIRRCHAARRRCATPFAWHRTARRAALPADHRQYLCHHHCRWIWQYDPRGRSAATRQYFSPVLGLRPLARFVALHDTNSAAPSRHLRNVDLVCGSHGRVRGVTFLHRAWLRHTSMLGPGMLVATGALIGLAIVWATLSGRTSQRFEKSG